MKWMRPSPPFTLSWVVGSAERHWRPLPSRSMAARGQLLFAIAQKVTKNACPCTPLHPAVLATGGMRQRHTKASLSLRTMCADDASMTARCSAPRRGLKGPWNQCLIASRLGLRERVCEHSGYATSLFSRERDSNRYLQSHPTSLRTR